MTLVSVVVPHYNRTDWLKAAVESVLAQSLDDFELIIVDDGSDEEAPGLDSSRDKRIRYVRQAHRGVSVARNHGMSLATGKYIAFLDSDDVFLPEKLQVQVEHMDANPEIVLSHTSYQRMDAAGDDLENIASGTFAGRVYPRIVTYCPIATPTVMLRRDAFERLGLAFPESTSVGEDNILWIDIARRHEILGIDRVLTKVRIHDQNTYLDPERRYRGGLAILSHAFREDPDFAFAFRRKALASVCTGAGRLFLKQGIRGRAIACLARAVGYWPSPTNLKFLLMALLPHRARKALRRLRRAAIGRLRRGQRRGKRRK